MLTGPLSGGTHSLSDADAHFTGEQAHDRAGSSLTGGLDLNDDGLDDIVVGARESDTAGDNSGTVYLLFSRGGV